MKKISPIKQTLDEALQTISVKSAGYALQITLSSSHISKADP
jgi:hypothetical protein